MCIPIVTLQVAALQLRILRLERVVLDPPNSRAFWRAWLRLAKAHGELWELLRPLNGGEDATP